MEFVRPSCNTRPFARNTSPLATPVILQFSKRAASEAAEFSRSRVQLLSVIGAACLECGEPAPEAGELIRRQLGNSFGDFFDFHVVQYSTAEAWLSDGKGFGGRPRRCLARLARCQTR